MRLLATLLLAGCTGRVSADVQLRLDPAAAARRAATAACSDTLCTPEDLGGRIWSARVMWGELGPDSRSLTMLGEDRSSGHGGELSFSLLEQTTLPGGYRPPGGGSEARPVPRMEFDFDYLDATVALPAGRFDVRTVFAVDATSPDVSGTMQRGDKLVRSADEPDAPWEWCSTGGCAVARDSVPGAVVQEPKLVDYVFPGQGNPEYIPFAVPLANDLALSADELAVDGALWSCAFDMTGAVRWRVPPAGLTDAAAVVDAFELSYEPDQQHAGDTTAISVTLEVVPAN
ncbi:MAG: hypothetical protein R3F59_10640 [Myxococcota bacterium]